MLELNPISLYGSGQLLSDGVGKTWQRIAALLFRAEGFFWQNIPD
jgi:hypothetical protein